MIKPLKQESKTRKIAIVSAGFITLILFLFSFQYQLSYVSAKIASTVSPDHINYGLVFPSEKLYQYFIIEVPNTIDKAVKYYITQHPKPRPEYLESAGSSEARTHCRANPEDYENCYPLLCPYLTKTMIDPSEGDTEAQASIGPGDLTDNWEVKLEVPPIRDYVGQDYDGPPAEKDEYGCDIAIHIKEEEDGNGGNGDGPLDEIKAATSPIPLPITLPRVGAWGAIVFASLGLIIVITKYRKK